MRAVVDLGRSHALQKRLVKSADAVEAVDQGPLLTCPWNEREVTDTSKRPGEPALRGVTSCGSFRILRKTK